MTHARINKMDDEFKTNLHNHAINLYKMGVNVEGAAHDVERTCARANVEYDPDGVRVVEEVYNAKYDGGGWVLKDERPVYVHVEPEMDVDVRTEADAEVETTAELDVDESNSDGGEEAVDDDTAGDEGTADESAGAADEGKKSSRSSRSNAKKK